MNGENRDSVPYRPGTRWTEGGYRMKRVQSAALILLVSAIVGQSLYLAFRTTPRDDPGRPASQVRVGDTLGFLSGHVEDGTATTLPLREERGAVTVLYAFHSECGFCDDVAPAWGRYFAAPDSGTAGLRRIALTRDPPATAADYARRFGWRVELLSVSRLPDTSREHVLVARTPWVFVFDSDGMLRFHDHGAELERIDKAIATIAVDTFHPGPDKASDDPEARRRSWRYAPTSAVGADSPTPHIAPQPPAGSL